MSIAYIDTKKFQPNDLQDLFLSVEWESGKYPDKLAIAMESSNTVFSAWDNEKLIGLCNALDDGIMTAYIHFYLKKLRKTAGLSQSQLAKEAGVSLRSIQMYEQRSKDVNKAQAITLAKIARVLGCDIEDLLETEII
ncbi:MAG: helix-turn-helix transcriptional regulator [Oscillospiraceae bacterium]|nr:helix-turn-helix transcriptional regulator [Oscillospiraceae bacterium]